MLVEKFVNFKSEVGIIIALFYKKIPTLELTEIFLQN